LNIVFLFLDQLSPRALSSSGNPFVHTPHMDALAASGTSFEQSYCAAPVCGPSRACVATGRLPHETGVLVNGMSIFPSMPTMGEVFRDAGYDTAWTGRWCVPGNGPDIRGFDCLHDTSQPLGQGMFSDSHVADCAIDYLGREHERPFLLGVSLCNPHDICYWVMQQSPPQGKLDPHTIALKKEADSLPFDFPAEGDLPPLPDNFDIDPNEPEFIADCRKRPHYGQEMTFTWDWDEDTWRRYLHAYYRLTEMVDVQVGRVMDALRESGLAEDTLVVLTSDHGEGMAGHRWVVKLGLYEEPMRVPLILSLPGEVPKGGVRANYLASGIDVLPTMCDYATIPCPEVTGVSLRPFVEHADLKSRPCLVSEFHPDPSDLDFQGRMVRSERYKYVAFSHGRNPEQLFDLELDPGETTNLSATASSLPVIDQHRRLLAEWLEAHADPFVPVQP
jgi:arylsulfatase A-like enzyme